MDRFVLKNNCFEFNSMIKQHTLDAGIETNFAPPHSRIVTDWVGPESSENKQLKALKFLLTIYSLSGLLEKKNFVSFLSVYIDLPLTLNLHQGVLSNRFSWCNSEIK